MKIESLKPGRQILNKLIEKVELNKLTLSPQIVGQVIQVRKLASDNNIGNLVNKPSDSNGFKMEQTNLIHSCRNHSTNLIILDKIIDSSGVGLKSKQNEKMILI